MRQLRCIIVLLHTLLHGVAVLGAQFVEENPQQFGLQPESNFAPINALQEDVERPGTFLALQGFALVELKSDNTPRIIAGLPQKNGTSDGNSSDARFGSMYGFVQVQNSSVILIADADNGCIREVDREGWRVSTHSGICDSANSDTKSIKDGSLKTARYIYPYDIASPPGLPNVQYVTDKNYLRVIFVDLAEVYTLIKETRWWSRGFFKRISFSPSNSIFITTHEDGIYVFDPTDTTLKLRSIITPDYNKNNSITNQFFNRTASGVSSYISLEALTGRFEQFEDVVPITDDVILATLGGSQMTQSLVLIDVERESLTLVCASILVGERNIPSILRDFCRYQTTGRDLQLINSTLYISGSPSTEDIYSSGVEQVSINDFCTADGDLEKYPISINKTLHEQNATCFLNLQTLEVGWYQEYTPTIEISSTILPEVIGNMSHIVAAIIVPITLLIAAVVIVTVIKSKYPSLLICGAKARDGRTTSQNSTESYLRPREVRVTAPQIISVSEILSAVSEEDHEYETIGADYQKYHHYESADQPNRNVDNNEMTNQQTDHSGSANQQPGFRACISTRGANDNDSFDNYVLDPTIVYASNVEAV